MKKIIVLILLFPLVSCNFFQKKSIDNQVDAESELVEAELSEKERFYVIDRNDVFLWKTPEANSQPMDTLSYGRIVEAEAEIGDFYKVMSYRTGNYAYIEKSKLGNLEDIKLINSDLPQITYLKEADGETQFFEKSKKLEKYISLELVEKSEYDREKANAVSFLLADTLNVVKKDGVITLHGDDDSTTVYKDIESDSDEYTAYKYEGQIAFLSQFLMSGMYYEASNYFFVDKKTGTQGQSFVDFPYISPDKKYIISLGANPYEGGNVFELYSLDENHKISFVFDALFLNWLPTYDVTQIFWSKNGYLYVPVNHAAVYWNKAENMNSDYQYIRVKVK